MVAIRFTMLSLCNTENEVNQTFVEGYPQFSL